MPSEKGGLFRCGQQQPKCQRYGQPHHLQPHAVEPKRADRAGKMRPSGGEEQQGNAVQPVGGRLFQRLYFKQIPMDGRCRSQTECGIERRFAVSGRAGIAGEGQEAEEKQDKEGRPPV